jgi:hypothetical protein
MSFPDPYARKTTATLTTAAVDNIPRTSSAADFGQFKSSDGFLSFTLSHQYGKRTRRVARLDVKAILADPLLTGVNALQSMSVYTVVDVPSTGFTIAAQRGYVENLSTWLGESNYANTLKFLGGES